MTAEGQFELAVGEGAPPGPKPSRSPARRAARVPQYRLPL